MLNTYTVGTKPTCIYTAEPHVVTTKLKTKTVATELHSSSSEKGYSNTIAPDSAILTADSLKCLQHNHLLHSQISTCRVF